MEIGEVFFAPPRMSGKIARTMEELATLLYPDSQNLVPEVWSQLTAAQATTTRALAPASPTGSRATRRSRRARR
jgi:hypothetical protein